MVGPALVLPDHVGGDQEAGARHVAVGAQEHPREVEEAGLPQKPDGVAGGDPVGPEVPGIAVAGDGPVAALVIDLVHLQHEVGVHQIVRIKDKIGVVLIPALPGQGAEQEVQGVALALLALIEPLIDDGPRPPGHLGGVVGAVVGHHVYVQQMGGIILLL